MENIKAPIDWADFERIDMRIGSIIDAKIFKEAKKPAYQLWIDFGTLGVKKSSAQITKYYTPENLKGRQVVAVVNLSPRQIAHFMSECLILGALDHEGGVKLLNVDHETENGTVIA